MSNTTKKKEDIKKEKEETKVEEPLLLTEEEFARRQRKKTKERVNKIIRVIGLIATFILFDCAIFDILWEPSYFGWMVDAITGGSSHNQYWDLVGPPELTEKGISIYDNLFKFGFWLPKLGMTILLVASFIVVLYLLIYCIIDFIELIKAMIKLFRDLTNDLEATANDGGVSFKKKKKPEPKPFTPSKKHPKRRKDNSLNDITDEELDALLRGEKPIDKDIEAEIKNGKDLFSEDDE